MRPTRPTHMGREDFLAERFWGSQWIASAVPEAATGCRMGAVANRASKWQPCAPAHRLVSAAASTSAAAMCYVRTAIN